MNIVIIIFWTLNEINETLWWNLTLKKKLKPILIESLWIKSFDVLSFDTSLFSIVFCWLGSFHPKQPSTSISSLMYTIGTFRFLAWTNSKSIVQWFLFTFYISIWGKLQSSFVYFFAWQNKIASRPGTVPAVATDRSPK